MSNQPIKIEKQMRPAQFAEDQILRAILKGGWPPYTLLPNERRLAEQMGVTRPTLREALQRLSREGWICIRHGKPTLVNDFWSTGGLSLLSTLTRYQEHFPEGFIRHLLEVRLALMPHIAELSVKNDPEALLTYLNGVNDVKDEAAAFAQFDWQLQVLMAQKTENPVFLLMLNDFTDIFVSLGMVYFADKMNRNNSRIYYNRMVSAISDPKQKVKAIVRKTMQESITSWSRMEKSLSK